MMHRINLQLVAVGLVIAVLWAASTIGAAAVIVEWKQHGEQHAFVKHLMETDAQHQAEHAALRQLIQMVNQQAAQSQARPGTTAPTVK